MVRKGGLEPPRSCDRQPLKLVRLPIPPLPHIEASSQPSVLSHQQNTKTTHTAECLLLTAYCLLPTAYYFLAGGAAGAGVFGAALAGEVSRIELDDCRVAQTASVTEVHMKMPASAQVIFCMVVTAPRGPKAAWLTPPNAAVISTFSPP